MSIALPCFLFSPASLLLVCIHSFVEPDFPPSLPHSDSTYSIFFLVSHLYYDPCFLGAITSFFFINSDTFDHNFCFKGNIFLNILYRPSDFL